MALMLDPKTLLAMLVILPLVEAVDALIVFAQKRDVYIGDFIATLLSYKEQLFMFNLDFDTSFW